MFVSEKKITPPPAAAENKEKGKKTHYILVPFFRPAHKEKFAREENEEKGSVREDQQCAAAVVAIFG